MLRGLLRDDPALRHAFGRALYDLRHKQKPKLSQEDLAHRAHLDRSYLGGLERGEHEPGLLTLWRLSHALHVPLSRLAQEIMRHYHPKA